MEKIIRCATQNDIESMRALWVECFPNDIEYSSFFFERIFRLECARVCEIGGEIAAMLHSFPYDFSTPERVLNAKYIYGVGTSKKFRSKGIAGELLENEARDCDFTVIIPQSESLFDFYERNGFTEIFTVSRKEAESGGKMNFTKAHSSDIEKLNEMYEAMCSGTLHPIRTYERWETIMAEFEFLGGGIALLDDGYCAYYEYDGRFRISELCSPSGNSPFGYECASVRIGDDSRIGAARPVSERAKIIFGKDYGRYLNLMHN